MTSRQSTILAVVLGIALVVTAWIAVRIAQFQSQIQVTTVYTDAPGIQTDSLRLSCRVTRNPKLDVRDYSYNVLAEPTNSSTYRYKTNLDAEPPVHVHILSISGGSGRVVVTERDKPVWLVLLSSRPAIWNIERAPGASIERVVASQAISELHFTDSLNAGARSILDLLTNVEPIANPMPDIQVIPQSPCIASVRGFQKYDQRQKFVPTIQGLRSWLGHPEMSYQSSAQPSYFEQAFQVPFVEPDVSLQRLAHVARLAEPPQPETTTQAATRASALGVQFARYANMPRRDDVKAVTFASPGDLLSSLDAYQKKGLLPASMPTSVRGARGLDVAAWYSFNDYQNAYTRRVPDGITEDACNGGRDHKFLIVEGSNGTNVVKCAWGNQMYFMGDGDDRIDDSWDDDIIYAGTGNDEIEAGWGNDLIFFNYGWGQDVVGKTCHEAAYRPQDSVGAKKIDWSKEWPYKNFIVFGKDVAQEDIVRVDNKLVHKQTGDSITLKDQCFNFVFWQ